MKRNFCFRYFLIFSLLLLSKIGWTQNYTTTIDTFYVPSPEYSASIGLDSLYFPCAITQPNGGSEFPLLILVHGTAALDMNASSTKDYLPSVGANYIKAETYMFYEIADSLSRNGIMVLRYDKRSFTLNCIEKPDCWYVDTISPYDYIKDVHYAVEFAKTLPNVDTCNIFLAGHSQGGSFVSQVGYDRSDIRGVLDMAGTAQPIDSIAIYQTEFVDSDPVGANILRQQFDSLRTGLWPMNDTLYGQHFSPRFWSDWISHSDSAVIVQKESDKPTALMYGTADRFVPPSIHYQIWQDSVTRPNVTFQLFDDMDHSFGSEYDSLMSPDVLNFMANWIHATTEPCLANLNELNHADLLLFPNPGEETIFLQSNSPEIKSFVLVNALGDSFANGTIGAGENRAIDVRNISSGVYFIRTDNTSIKWIKK